MRRSRFRPLPPSLLILGVMAAALAEIIGLELREAALDEVPTSIVPVWHPSEKPPVPGSGTVPSDQAAGHVAAILARPLFSPSRRPDEPAANKTADLGRLTGVLVSPAGKSAIFAGPAGGKPVVVREGERIGEYVVSLIEAGAVTIIEPSGQRVLHPAFDSSPPPPKQPPPPKPAVPAPITPATIVSPGSAAPAARQQPAKWPWSTPTSSGGT